MPYREIWQDGVLVETIQDDPRGLATVKGDATRIAAARINQAVKEGLLLISDAQATLDAVMAKVAIAATTDDVEAATVISDDGVKVKAR